MKKIVLQEIYLDQKLDTRGGVVLDAPCCAPIAHKAVEIVFFNRTSSITNGVGPDYYDVNVITLRDALVIRCSCA